MADPYGGNIDANRAALAERADPNFAATKIATRVRQLRTEMDTFVAGVTEASVLDKLNDSAIDKDVGGAAVTECAGVSSPAGVACAISSDTGAYLVIGAVPVVATDATGLGFYGTTPVAQAAGPAPLGGANISLAYDQAEVQAVSDKVDAILTILSDLGLTS